MVDREVVATDNDLHIRVADQISYGDNVTDPQVLPWSLRIGIQGEPRKGGKRRPLAIGAVTVTVDAVTPRIGTPKWIPSS